jgi:hypothetical protein
MSCVFGLNGTPIAVLANKDFAPGEYRLVFAARDLPSGIYFCRLEAEGVVKTRKLVLVK